MIREAISAERRELSEMLDALPPARWDDPTLCEGWRVREVVAHMTTAYRYSAARFVGELLRSGGAFTKMSDRCAKRDAAALSIERLAAALRDNVDHPWKPPRGGYEGALTHDVVHGLDISVALGLGREVPEERLRVVLAGLARPQGLRYFGVDLSGVELRADDLDWSFGAGVPLTGAARDLVLLLSGRRLPAGHLHGEPAKRFARVVAGPETGIAE